MALRRFGLPALVTLSLSMALYSLALLLPLHFHSAQTFFAFESIGLDDLAQAWRSRVLSLAAARGLEAASPWLPRLPTALEAVPWQSVAIAQWLALWFLGIGAVLIAAFREQALFHVLGTFACVVFGYSVGTDLRVYPWDMPALAVFAVFVALLHTERPPWTIVLAIWTGMLFKETALVLCLFPLAFDWSWRRRAAWAAATGLGCVGIKLGLDLASGNTALGLTMSFSSFYDEGPLWWWNLRQLASGFPLAINGGTLLAFLLLPNASRTVVAFKWIAGAFALGNLLAGVITEYRIWFELIPLGLHALAGSLRSGDASR